MTLWHQFFTSFYFISVFRILSDNYDGAFVKIAAQSAFTCSNLTIEKPGVSIVNSQQVNAGWVTVIRLQLFSQKASP